jgi:thiamine transport system substrate-binding protein
MRRIRALALCGVLTLAATSCSLIGEGDDSDGKDARGSSRVVLVTHESFALPEALIEQFEADSGFDLAIRAAGDAGALTNKLVLTRDAPTGDVAFGVDNTFGSRAIDESVFVPYDAELPAGAEAHVLPGDDGHLLAPIDTGNVCVNIDDTWFTDVAPPRTLEDLTRPAYQDLFVLPGATTSSPGLAFLLATIAEYGDEWPDYWQRLMDNGAKLTPGWSDAYEVDFTQGGGKGARPIVLSYDSSPAFTVDGKGGTTTSALLDTCFRQVEYAGVLDGAANPEGAQELVEFLLSEPVQAALPDSMYVFPVDASVALPPDWATFAKQPKNPYSVDPAEIAEHRDEWLREWSDVTSR